MKNYSYIVCLLMILAFSSISTINAKTTIIFLGDSLTEGYGLDKSEAFPKLFEIALKEKGYTDIKVINAGISGSTSASAVARLKWYLRSKPDFLILALGANDGLRGINTTETKGNLASTIKLAQKNKIHVVVAGMKMPPNYGPEFTEKFEALFPSLAEEYQTSLIPFLLEGVAGNPRLNLPDGIHPNREGHKIITEILMKILPPLLPHS